MFHGGLNPDRKMKMRSFKFRGHPSWICLYDLKGNCNTVILEGVFVLHGFLDFEPQSYDVSAEGQIVLAKYTIPSPIDLLIYEQPALIQVGMFLVSKVILCSFLRTK